MSVTVNGIDLGLTQEELRERIIAQAAAQLVEEVDEDGVRHDVRRAAREAVQAGVKKIADEEVRPWVEGEIDKIVMQQTNEWGEATGKALTFREYLAECARGYLTEPVDYDGRSKDERDSYNWKKYGTRVAYMVDKHLHHEIQMAMEKAVKGANEAIAEGIEGAVKIKLSEIVDKLKVKVETGR